MHITFSIARFNYEKLDEVLPTPTVMDIKDRSITVTYHFGQKLIGGRQIMRVGFIKKSIEVIFNNQVSWLGEPLQAGGEVYGIDAFYHSYCRYKTYPKWVWVKHRSQLMSNASRYAVRLHENGLFCFETVLGYMYIQNQRISSKITKYEVLEQKARWITAKMYERINSGEFKKLDKEALHEVRVSAGKQGGKASVTARQTKAQQRQEKLRQLWNNGIDDVFSIAKRLDVTTRTIYNDLKVLGIKK